MKKLIAPLVFAAVLLAGCSAPEKDASYESVNSLAVAYEKAVDGVECGRTDRNIYDAGWDYVNCDKSDFVELFTSNELRTEVIAKNPLKAGQKLLLGTNWMIVAEQSKIEAAQEVLGGDVGR
ncbi:hypothetical protein NHF46_14425 [Arthrobacter alpinus]|nr:hypothetical protein [Arthrobacter alpinus]